MNITLKSFFALLITTCITMHNLPSQTSRLPLSWNVGNSKTNNTQPEKWYTATVPGAVQLDFAKGLNYGTYYFAENWKDYLWMENDYFVYKTSFASPILPKNTKCYFVSKGIDYEFEIWLNGAKLYYQEGMFTPVNIDLTDKLQSTNELQVWIYPVPKLYKQPADRGQAAQSVKPAVSYGWDWHPRLLPVGIWDETYLDIKSPSQITEIDFHYALDVNSKTAKVSAALCGKGLNETEYELNLSNAEGKNVYQTKGKFANNNARQQFELSNLNLWWPHDQGVPYLYNLSIQLLGQDGTAIQEIKQKVGFRRIKLVKNEGSWPEPPGFPKTRSTPPIQLEINGRNIFAKGTNWVNPEIFPGIITRERYNELLNRAKEANFNILRVWGGGIVNKESFFELCDEKGILVWQEFPLACNNYEDNDHYLSVLKQESESIIKRLRNHASLAIWCGGNELFNSWSKMTDQSLALRLLNSQCFLLNPETPFIPTSPIMGMGHGHYVFRDWNTNEEVFQWMAAAHNTAYTEFGIPAPASVDILKTIIPENELWPPKAGTSWESHHAFHAWVGDTWLMPDMLKQYFGEAANLEELVANGQLVQCEGYKCIYEEARRQKPYCSMALNWCFNEPWPTATNNSIISWPNVPKPGFEAVKNACRPVLASARIKKFVYSEGEEFTADIFMLNDAPTLVNAGKMIVKLSGGGIEVNLLNWDFDSLPINKNLAGPTVRCILPTFDTDRIKLVLDVEGKPEYHSEYTILYKKKYNEKKKVILNQ